LLAAIQAPVSAVNFRISKIFFNAFEFKSGVCKKFSGYGSIEHHGIGKFNSSIRFIICSSVNPFSIQPSFNPIVSVILL
jgi:hypothetical protein